MKVVEILKLGENIAKALQYSCITLSDFQYIALYDEYEHIMALGGKKTYAIAYLSSKYNISERKVYYLIKKFGKDCKISAVG